MIVEMITFHHFGIKANVLSVKVMQLTALVWLVLSAAFDTVDPNIRLTGLEPSKASVKWSGEDPGAELYLGPFGGYEPGRMEMTQKSFHGPLLSSL